MGARRQEGLQQAARLLSQSLPEEGPAVASLLSGLLRAAIAALGGSSGRIVLSGMTLLHVPGPVPVRTRRPRSRRVVVTIEGGPVFQVMPEESPATQAMRTGQRARVEHAGNVTAVAQPILTGERVGGALEVEFAPSEGLDEERGALLAVFASNVAMVLEHARSAAAERARRRALQARIEQMERFRQQIATADDHMRREIAELLHSRVQNRLLVVWHRLGQCAALIEEYPQTARAMLAEIRDDIDAVREQEIRQASHLLHPSVINVGLAPAVQALLSRFEPHFAVALDASPALLTFDDPLENQIPREIRLCLYRVLEEALNNVLRHAAASRVAVTLGVGSPKPDAAGRGIQMVVQDNGQGFDPAIVLPGLGLSSIAGRVEGFAGTWEIASVPGHGTTLSVCLPIPAPEHDAVSSGARDGTPDATRDGRRDGARATPQPAAPG